MTARRPSCWRTTDAKPSKRCSSTSCAAVPTCAKSRSEQDARHEIRRRLRDLLAPDRCDGRALLVPAALIVAAAARTGLLAGGANADVGLSPALYRPECRIFRPSRRYLHRRGAAVGYSFPRPAWLFGVVSGGDVVAQPR